MNVCMDDALFCFVSVSVSWVCAYTERDMGPLGSNLSAFSLARNGEETDRFPHRLIHSRWCPNKLVGIFAGEEQRRSWQVLYFDRSIRGFTTSMWAFPLPRNKEEVDRFCIYRSTRGSVLLEWFAKITNSDASITTLHLFSVVIGVY